MPLPIVWCWQAVYLMEVTGKTHYLHSKDSLGASSGKIYTKAQGSILTCKLAAPGIANLHDTVRQRMRKNGSI